MEVCRNAGRPVMIHTNEPVGHLYPGKGMVTPAQVARFAHLFPQAIRLAIYGYHFRRVCELHV